MGRSRTRSALVGALGSLALIATAAPPAAAAAGPAAPTGPVAVRATATAPELTVGQSAWISVSVATLWRTPRSPRTVDAPALAHPARIQRWLREMTLTERRALSGRADTQALFGDRVRVIRLRTHWAKVIVPSQPSPRDSRGYPGWVPRRQLTAHQPVSAARVATVTDRTAWLLTDRSSPSRMFRISFGTDLPVVGRTPDYVRVATPSGARRRIAASAVVVHPAGTPARSPSRRSLVRTAKSFRGLPYLWSGVSGFGLDCSGLTWLSYRVHGITLPRDAAPQSESGTAVTALRWSDLMFYATDGIVHHVSMYIGNGMMIHAPGTGQTVQVVPTSALSSEYSGARRYYLP